MQLVEKIVTFVKLSEFLKSQQSKDEIKELSYRIQAENKWFTEDNVQFSLNSITTEFLDESKLKEWTKEIIQTNDPKKVGVIAAGNIPLVCFSDILSVLIVGHHLHLKLSSSDSILVKYLLTKLCEINPNFENYIHYVERLNDIDALIATGSDNTAKHFDYYFASKPRIIRFNRTSVAVIDQTTTRANLANLGYDIFRYFGLGCRNISKIFVPKGYDFIEFYESIAYWDSVMMMNKYANNYDYNKSILLVNGTPHLDNGFLLVRSSEDLVSPISVLFYQEYNDFEHLNQLLTKNNNKIQCVVSNLTLALPSIPFGGSQVPTLDDYPDGVNVLQFLNSI